MIPALPFGLWLRIGTLALAALAFGLLYWRYDQRGDTIRELRAELAQIQAVADAHAARGDALVAEIDRLAAERAATSDTIRQGIRNAPPSADAPVAPVLRNALDGLRRR